MSALGEAFRTTRESRGLTLSEVAEHIHIRTVYLAAIEAEDWHAIGAPVYVRGFIRTYARFLGMDAEDAVARFSDRVQGDAPVAAASVAPVASRRVSTRSSPSPWAIAATVFALALVAFVGYEYAQYRSNAPLAEAVPTVQPSAAPSTLSDAPSAQPGVAQAGSPPVSAGPPPPTAKPLPSKGLAIRVTERSWLRVVVDGNVALEGIFPSGTFRSFNGKSASVRAGNAGGVDVTVKGKNLGTLGTLGEVAERSFQL